MIQLIDRGIQRGERILNHSNMEVITAEIGNTRRLAFGVVEMSSNGDEPILGYFNSNPLENVIYMNKNGIKMLAMSLKTLGERAYFSKMYGVYVTSDIKGYKSQELRDVKGSGSFPYQVSRLYESHANLNNFNIGPKLDSVYNEKYKSLLNYTFGLEYETTSGYIPQEECYRTGLVPLRDGSISGVEYASIILSNEDGLERVKNHLSLLKEYTSFNTDCSYHIHMGGFPLNTKAIYILYTVWGLLEYELKEILPKFAFETDRFKSSRKSYCKVNPGVFRDFGELYRYLTEGHSAYSGVLNKPHPSNEDQSAKWRIRERYWAQNLIGMCFYKSPKTVEYRMLAPSYNENKIIFWIYLFNAIMLYSEILSEKLGNDFSILFSLHKERISLDKIFLEVYPKEFALKMIEGKENMGALTKSQTDLGDLSGARYDLDDAFFKKGVLSND